MIHCIRLWADRNFKLFVALLFSFCILISAMVGFAFSAPPPMSGGGGSSLDGCTNVAGALTCTSFTGDGTGLTGVTATDDNNSKMTRLAEEAIAAAGLVDISGTPANHYWGVWTDANTQKGVSVTASKVACSNADGDPVACTNLTDTAFSGYAALAGATFTGALTLDDGSGASPDFILKDATDETATFSKVDAGYLTITTVAGDGVQVTTGNLRVGNGSNGQTLDGEDAYVEGLLEVDGMVYADGGINGTLTGTATGLAGTPNITVGTISAGASGFSVDADGDVTAKSVTATKVANTAGTNTLYNDNDTQTIGFTWKGPHQTTAQTDDFVFQVPTGEPAAGQVMAAGTVASHATTANWVTPATLTGAETLTNKTLDGPIVTSKEEDCHADGNLTVAQLSNTIFTNYDQADGNATCILPTAARGMSALFTVATARAKTYGVRAKSTDKIYLLAAAGTISAGDDHGAAVMVNAQIGQQFACYTFKTGATDYDWVCKAIAIGTSTFEARPAP